MFDEKYIDSLPDEPLLAISQIVNVSLDEWANTPEVHEGNNYEYYLEAFAIVQALAQNVNDLSLDVPKLNGDTREISKQIVNFFMDVKSQIADHFVALKMAQFSNKYHAKFGNIFAYEFSEGDLNRIQDLINSLREMIVESELFEPEHKQRLLARLEKVQTEMHKKMSDLDRFWGLMGDAGVALGKFGEDAKPIVDRIREISEIVWRTQSRAEELPSDTPMGLLTDNNEA